VSDVLLIRHGRTPWNECDRIQGHRDIDLSANGRAEIAARCIPPEFAHYRWYVSPLARAVQTARLLGATEIRTDARLMELHWGTWEGSTRHDLRTRHGSAYEENAARGLDFRPPGGESPRELRRRLSAWLASIAAAGEAVIAVTHKGVIQMALSMATGWNLVSRAPVRLDWQCGQLFDVSETPLRLQATRLNVALATREAAAAAGDAEAGG
jgi:probable phosphoglycerate mutase